MSTNAAKKIIDDFCRSADEYADEIQKAARIKIADIESNNDACNDDYQQALYSLHTPLMQFRHVEAGVLEAIGCLEGNVEREYARKTFSMTRATVRRQMENAYGDAARIIEDGAIRYLVSQYGFSSDVGKISEGKRKAAFRKAWDVTRIMMGSAHFSAVMDAFVDMLGVIDAAWAANEDDGE